MTGMTQIFGEVAELYDEIRPGYPEGVAAAIRAYHGGPPSRVVEIGAGTGKGTAVLTLLGAPVTCVEPDPRMAAVLRARFPRIDVEQQSFERWRPPSGGVPLIAFAMSWHLLDAATRNPSAYAALRPGGTLAVFGHRYAYADPAVSDAIGVALRATDPTVRDRPDRWAHDDIVAAGLFDDVRLEQLCRDVPLDAESYLKLVQTFSPFRRRSAEAQAAALRALRVVLADAGGHVTLDLRTTVVLARRGPDGAAADPR
jgi:SAM-dependent methyltransferase